MALTEPNGSAEPRRSDLGYAAISSPGLQERLLGWARDTRCHRSCFAEQAAERSDLVAASPSCRRGERSSPRRCAERFRCTTGAPPVTTLASKSHDARSAAPA
jgi:hypothetical protein